MKLSVLMPVYNEAATFAQAVKAVLDVEYPCEMELVIVDDGSQDQTPQILAAFQDERIVTRRHASNQGKGAAIRTAAQAATGDYVIVCDADLEYAPEEIPELLEPVLHGDAQVVYGTRTFGSHTAFSFWYVLGNKVVTMFANALFDTWISDLETCFKLMPLALYRDLDIRSAGFGMEAEITGKLLKRRQLPYEVPISYKARQREEGKKLTWRDGVVALWILTRVRLASGGGVVVVVVGWRRRTDRRDLPSGLTRTRSVVSPPGLAAETATDDTGPAPPGRRIASRLPRWALPSIQVLALAALALGVRRPGHLFTRPFWLDESWVADSTRAPWGQLRLLTSSTPIGWTVLLRAVPRWGDAERYRLLPLAFAAACVVPAWCLGRQLRPAAGRRRSPAPASAGALRPALPWAGWLAPPLAGLAAALAPQALGYPYLKQYTTEAFVSLLLVALLAWVEQDWSPHRLAILGAVAVVSFLVANTAPLITAAMFGGLVLTVLVRRAWSRLGWLAAAGAGVFAADAVLYRTLVATSNDPAMHRYWEGWYIPSTNWHRAVHFADTRTVIALERMQLGPWPVTIALILAGIIALWRAGMPAAALVVPITFVELIVAGLARQYPYLENRTSMFLTVLATVVAAIGLAAIAGRFLRWRWTAPLGLAVLIGIGSVFLPGARRAERHPMLYGNTRDQIQLLRNLRQPGDVVLLGSLAAYEFAYYWEEQPTFESAPPSSAVVRFQVSYPRNPNLVVANKRSPEAAREAMDRLPPGTRRVWIILLHEDNLIPEWVSNAEKHGGRLLADPRHPCTAFSPAELARAGLLRGPCPLLVRFNQPA